MKEQWVGFKEGKWTENIDVRDFILQNYTLYVGDDAFLTKPTTATRKLCKMVEELIGSTWTEKLPKEVIMEKLRVQLAADGENILVVGDGRSEIFAGAKMGALNISRLDKDDEYRRNLHKNLGTHVVVSDFNEDGFYDFFKK